MMDKMSMGEKMIWAAVFANSYKTTKKEEVFDGVEMAYYAVMQLREEKTKIDIKINWGVEFLELLEQMQTDDREGQANIKIRK